jgi:hypothetical protein
MWGIFSLPAWVLCVVVTISYNSSYPQLLLGARLMLYLKWLILLLFHYQTAGWAIFLAACSFAGRIKDARKFGRNWLIPYSGLVAFAAERAKVGRPAKNK